MSCSGIGQVSKTGPAPAQEEAAGALGSLVRGHTANQEAVRAAGAIARLISLVTTSAPAVRVRMINQHNIRNCIDR